MTAEEVILKLGLDNSSLKSGMAGADYFVQNSMKATLNSLKNLVRVNMVSMAFQVMDYWDQVTEHIAEVMSGSEHFARMAGFAKEQADVWRTANKERWLEEEKLRKQQEQNAKDKVKRAILDGEVQSVERETQLMQIADETKREETRLKFQKEELKFLRSKIDYQANTVEQGRQMLAVARAEQDVLQTTQRLQELRQKNFVPPTVAAQAPQAKNQAYLDNVKSSQIEYFFNIAHNAKGNTKDKYLGMVDKLMGRDQGADGKLDDVVTELQTLTAGIKKTGKLPVEISPLP